MAERRLRHSTRAESAAPPPSATRLTRATTKTLDISWTWRGRETWNGPCEGHGRETMNLHPRSRTLRRAWVVGVGCALGCAPMMGSGAKSSSPHGPHVLALSTYHAPLGTPVRAYVDSMPPPNEGAVSLRFRGTYHRSDGKNEPVDVVAPGQREDGVTVSWVGFGPFANPFDADRADPQTGLFVGDVSARVTRNDGTIDEDPQSVLHVTFAVDPSILIEDFEPAGVPCNGPVKRAFGGLSYTARVRAVGFAPTSFVYTMRVPAISEGPSQTDPTVLKGVLQTNDDGTPVWATSRLEHAATGPEDALSPAEAFAMPVVPDSILAYNLMLDVQSVTTTGATVAATLVMNVTTPVSLYYDGRYQLAELYAPVPQSGCMPGGPTGRTASYTDTQTETAQRAFTLTLSENWLASISASTQGTVQNTWQTSDGMTYTHGVTDTTGWSHSDATGGSQSESTSLSSSLSSSTSTMGSTQFQYTVNGSQSSSFTLKASGTGMVMGNGGLEVTLGPFKPSGGGGVSGAGTLEGSWSTSSSTGYSSSSTGTTGYTDGTTTGSVFTTGNTNTRNWLTTDTVNGSTATTDSTAASYISTLGGSDSTAVTRGTSNSTGASSQTADGWTETSSDALAQGYSGLVIAGTYGVFYRQKARFEQEAFLIEYDMCGNGQVVGTETFDDYAWAVDLAQAPACPPLPPTDFPPAQCYLPPCPDLP